uniref:Spectrin repeat containing, nuclear envelope 1a n=1 Tax=Astyanax mexicanus TaxID=7994 RepID=A0A8B9L4Z7_ASTMX
IFINPFTRKCPHNGKDEQEAVQKRTFTKWINSHLAKRDPPLVVKDLYEDIKDGVMLLALLEVLSGHKLPCEQGRKLRRIHWLANVGTALRFLEGRRSVYRGSPIKLVNINTTDIVDGRPSIVLGLIWTIILYFQIEELTSSLPPQKGQNSSNSSVDSSNSTETASPPVKRKPRLSFQGGAKRALLKWVQRTATKRLGLDVKDFGPSWRSGVAFHAVIFALRPQLVNMERVWNRPNRANLEEAFSLAERELGIPRLLDPEDVDVDKPDEKSIMTYVAQFLKHHPDAGEAESVGQQEEVLLLYVFCVSLSLSVSLSQREQRKVLRELKVWADQLEKDCAQAQMDKGDPGHQYKSFKQYRVQYELKRRQVLSSLQSTQRDGILTSDQALFKQAWERISTRLLDWHIQLDSALPNPLGAVGIWLHQAEKILQEEPLPQQSHEQTANAIHQTLQQHQVQCCIQNKERSLHRDRSVSGVPVPAEQLQDMAERLNYISTSSHVHLSKLEFWELKYRMLALLTLGESKLKSWIVKYGRLETTQLLLQSYVSFVEGQQFFQKYESLYEDLKQAAVLYTNADSSAEEAVRRFLRDMADQWRSLAVEIRSVRSMLKEVEGNWEKYSSAVSSLQAWLEDAQVALHQPENTKREFFRNLPHWMDQHTTMNDSGNFLIETCDETVSRDLKHQLLLLNGRWRDMFIKAKQKKCSTSSFVQYKTAARSAQLRARDTVNGDRRQTLTTMASIKGQLYKVQHERLLFIVRELQVLMQEALEWRRVAETNGNLTRRFEESRAELEKALRVGQACLKERGDPAELLSKHNDFFGRLDQRVLNAYLKACDDLTDILPEEEQQGLQESVRRLHKQWKDIQAEAPAHLLRLKVEAERRIVLASLQECRIELQKEDKAIATSGSERVIREHRVYFRQKDPLAVCERRLKTMEQLCQKLPENDPMQRALLETKDHLLEVRDEVERTYVRFQQHPDKWREWHLHTKTGVITEQAKSLVKKAAEIQLGAQNHSLLHDQAQAAQERVQEIHISLEKMIMGLEKMQVRWQNFNSESEAFSSWVCEREKELEALDLNSAHLDQQLQTVEVKGNDLKQRRTDGLQQHMDALGPSLSPEDLQRLQVRKEDCLQPVCEAQSLLQRRSEALGKLETFLVTYRSATNSVQTLQGAVEGRGSWDQAKAEQLNQDLGQLAQKLASLEVQAISLDSSLNKASLHLHRAEGERTSCRRLVDEQGSGLQRLQRSLGTRQSEAETLAGLWNSFRGRKELLLRSLMELEEKVRKTWLTEPSTQNFQQRYCFSRCYILFFSLSNEIHFMVPQREIWLFQIARQIMKCVGTTSYEYENIKYVEWVIFWQEQCAVLLDVCKDYFTLKSRITSAVERAHAVTAAQSGQHNPEDIRRALSRLEAVKPELAGTQEELNLFFSKGKHLISELRKLPEHTGESVRTEMDCIVDRWLDTSERLDSDIDHLTVFLALWNEINSIANDIECWTATSVSELSEGAVNLLSSSNVDERLAQFKVSGKNHPTSLRPQCLLRAGKSRITPNGSSSFAFRPSLERSCQASLTLSDGRAGDPEASQTMELLSSHQALVQEAWVRLRGLQEYQAFNEALRAMGDWLEEVEEKLEKLESTEGDKKEVEERLERVQDILLMKGEGEVKLNMAAGKGELVIKSSGEAGQGVIHFKLQEVEDSSSMYVSSTWTVSQWGLFVESRAQLQGWLEQVEAEVKGPLEPQLGLREKRQQLDRLCLLSADVEDHQGALCYLEESAAELYKRTGDATFREDETALLRAQFDDVRAATEVMCWLQIVSNHIYTDFLYPEGVLEGLQAAEVMEEKLKARLNELCGFSTDLGPQSERVSALIKLHNSLGLRASRECQNKEKLLEQRFRSSLRDFRQWLVNANISTAKCFDSPHSIQEASAALQRIQEFMSDREQGQARLDAVLAHGEQLSAVVQADRVEAVRAKTSAASDDWRSLMDNLQQREAILQGLQSRMQAFEESLQPLQDWLNRTEITVQDSSTRLHDLPAKRLELCKLQSVLEEMCCREPELGGLRERAHSLWEGQAAGKGFVHRVCQLAARYLALSNRTKEKVSRIERVVGEHQLFSQGLQELQSWVSEAQKILETCRSTTADKSMLVTRMGHLEDLLTARQEREIQLKMLITRGEAVQRNTSAEGVPVVRKQIQDLKDSWDLLLSGTIQCKSQLEGALSHWTSYQEDVSQFEGWLERVEESLGSSDKHYTEMRDKTANLRKAKLLYEEVLSRSSPLDTIATKGSNMTEHSATQQEVHKLNERYEAVKAKAKAAVSKAEELVLVHQEYQRGLHMFEDWLEQEQSSLALLSPLDGDVDTLEKTLKELETLQSSCSQGLTLLKSALASREQVVPWGVPQIEERALETAQREWQEYQERMRDTKTQVVQTLSRLQQLESCFQSLDQWVEDIERKQWQMEAGQKQSEMEGLSALAQQIVEDAHVSARVSTRVTQLTARYHAVLLRIQETVKQLQEEIMSIAEAQSTLRTFSVWQSVAAAEFRTVSESKEALDRTTMEKKMKRLETLQGDMDHGHRLLKTLREKVEQAISFLDDSSASKLEREVQAGRSHLEELILGLRAEHSTTERRILLYKEFQERYKTQQQWLSQTRALLSSSVEPKAELYQRRAQLAKYKAVEQALLSRNSAVSSVLEKGETLLSLLHSPSIKENMDRLQTDYKGLRTAARAIMEEIAGFEERLAGLKERGEELVSGCSERLQARLRQQTQSHLQGARDSYSAICSTAQRVYQSLDRELQRHVSLRDTLQQCQTWLSNIQEELQPPCWGLSVQVKQERTLQEQASTYLQLVCSTCDLSDEKVRETAADIQQVKIQVEERMLESQELAENWRTIESLRSDLESRLREAEQLLQNMFRRSAELEPKVAQNQLDQAQDFIQEMQARQADLAHLRESVGKLVTSQESPELLEVGRLRRAWLELGKQAAKLLEQREEDLQRSGDYHECLSTAEELFDQLSSEWDYLTRGDAEKNTVEYLDALKKLSLDLQDQRCVLDDLRDNRNTILPRLSLEDKDLVKEQVGYLEQRWIHLEMQVQQKIQDTMKTLEDLNHLEDQLRETQEWAEVQRPSVSEVLKTSPPPDLAQSFLFDHLSFCAELEAKQQLLTQVVSEADSLSSHLGLDERRSLQALVQEVQTLLESLGAKAAQHRKSLSKVFTERTQFLQALDRATGWIKQQEQRVLADEHIALLPDELSKQVSTCKNICSTLRAYQVELTSLWTQGRELVMNATEEEKTETLQRLEELQGTFESSLQRCTQHLQHLEKALVIRKYFKVDLDRVCEWLREAEAAVFPVIDLSGSDERLQNQLDKYQQLLDQTSAYENLLLIVQRAGQEILPTLNEVDHCYLDEKLNGLPQQYNNILVSTKEKRERVQRVIVERREFESLIEVTHKALRQLQEQCDALEEPQTSQSLEGGQRLHSDYSELEKGLANLFQAMKELRGKTQDFQSMGQPYKPEVVEQLVSLHSRLNRVTKDKVKQLNSTLNTLKDYNAAVLKMDSSMNAIKEKLCSDEHTDAMQRLSSLHKLAKDLEDVASFSETLTGQRKELGQHFESNALKTQVASEKPQLQALKSKISDCINECENSVVESCSFQTEIKVTLKWLKTLREKIRCPFNLQKTNVDLVEDEVRSVLALEDEMKSRLKLLNILRENEKQKSNTELSSHIEGYLKDIEKLETEVRQAALQSALSLLQTYKRSLRTTCQWLGDADTVLKQTSVKSVDLEDLTEYLQETERCMYTCSFIVLHNVWTAIILKRLTLKLHLYLNLLFLLFFRCSAQWSVFQIESKEFIKQMSEIEKRLEGFSTAKASSLQEAEDKLQSHHVSLGFFLFIHKLTKLEEHIAQFDETVSGAMVSHSVCAMRCQWTQLNSVARAQEKALKDTVHDWRCFTEKVTSKNTVSEDLHSRVPDSVVEKAASMVALNSLLEYHDSFSREVERESSALTLLKHHALSLLLQPVSAGVHTHSNQSSSPWHRPATPTNLSDTPCNNQSDSPRNQPATPTNLSTTSCNNQSTLCEELVHCSHALSELDVAVQEFGEQNPLLARQLSVSLSKLTELHSQTSRLAEGKTTRLKKAEQHFEEFNEMLTLVLNWTEKAETLISTNIVWSPASMMQEQIRTHQALLREWRKLQGDMEGLVERVGLLGDVVQTEALHQQVAELSHHAEELQQRAKSRLLSLQDAAKDLGRLESEVKSLHQSVERVQETLASPDLAHLSLREQLVQRQLLLTEMEGIKVQVQALQTCMSNLQLPEEAMATLPLCVTAQNLQQDSSHLQHTAIQQCNILQEAMVQYEQYEQEVKNLQKLIEEAHRVIQDRPVATGNIQELQTQIQHHEELAQKIKGYQEQIAALNSKCKMLTVKAKHATMLLTVSEVDGLSDDLEELEEEEVEMSKHPATHPSVVMMTAGRCHTLLSPVTEESGEEGTNSEVSSPPACRSPSPGPNADASLNQVPPALLLASLIHPSYAKELYDPSMESSASANLDDLQRSWETLKNVISEKQKSLYEALERQQHYQEALQSVSTKMESIETSLNEGLEPGKSPESQMAAHQALMDEILMLQDEISALQACFSEELQRDEESPEQDVGDQLALHSTLTVLGERMATIRMKASGKRQLLEERLSEQLEEQRQEQALQRYHSEAEELDHWLLSTRASLTSALQPNAEDMDMEEQLIDCQNMLMEIEQKVLCLSELSVHSESLLLEGKVGMRGDAEQLTLKLHGLKSSLLELQRILQDKHTHIQGSLLEQEDSEPDSSLSQSPSVMDWLSQARSTRSQQHQDTVQRQRVRGNIYVVSNVLVCLWMVHCFKSLRFSALNIVCTFCVCYTQTLAEAEDGLREFEQRVCEMRGRGETLQQDPVSTQELLKLQDVYEELVEMVGSRRSSLNQTLVLKAQYEKALQDLQELVDTAHDKMAADQKMTVGSVLEVQILLDKHKEFFQGLEAHVVLTQAFFRQVSGVVVQREAQALEQTVAQAQTVLKQAHRRGVELEGILEAWSRFVGDYQAVYRQLEAVESSIPSVGLVEETEERLTERIALYQRLKSSLAERQQQLYEVLEDGKKLLLSVCCSELEAQLTQLGEHWLCCTTKVNKELHRLDSTLKHWTSYQSDSAELGQWLASALDRLEFWSTQSVTVPQELETVRDHLHAFLEFSKEVDAKSSLRSSVLSRGNQLLRLKRVDTAALRSHLGQVETQWADLLTRIPVVQEKLHQLQMEKLASRHAITELMSWISLMENIIQEDQSKIMEAVGSEVVQTYIQKYKGFRIDLSCKQLTVDFVNQSVLQMSSQDVEGKRSDKTDFAERLGAMNRRWQILQGLITEKIQLLEGLLESWLEYENGVQALKTWISMQEEKTKRKPRIEDVASAQNALKDCQELEELLKEKEKELEKVEEKGRVLVQDKKGEASSVVMETLKGLNQSWTNLDQMIGQTKVSLRAVLEQWSLYKRACEEIHGYLMEGRYSISRLHLLTGSPEAVLVQVENLENLQEELDRQESSLKKFGSLTEQLLKDSHPSVADSLNTALSDVNHRWNTLLEQISEQLRNSKSLLQLWQHYKQLHEHNSKDVQRLEERAERLLNSAAHREITEEEVKTWIRDCSDLLKTHGSVQGTLQQLTEVEEQLRLQVEPSAMATFHTDYLSLNQRLATVGHGLHRQQSLLEAGMKDYESFTDELDSLSRCPEEAEEVLKVSDPAVSAELFCLQERMDKLKTQMLKLSRLSPDLEHLNGLGYRLPLNDQEMIRLQNLNRTWASCSAHTTERFSKLQAAVLQRQSFLEKCEAWLTFLTQTEEKLAAEISGNYQSLLEQQREHELFQAEMFSRQQILYSIISDGHQLLNQGQVEDRDDFGLKLALLSNQWQGVVRRAQQRRGIIDGLVCQWQRYTELAEKLRHWLKEVQEPEEQQEGGTVTLQQARGILDHIQLKERVLQRQQGSYVLAVEAGRQLLLSADARAEALLQSELTDLQERWRSTSIRLDERKKELLSLLKDWEQCEKGIAASHEKLRAFKRKLSLALPDHHEELHSEQIRCKELEGSTEGWTDDVTGLCVLRDALSSNLSSDDLTVLQERLELLQRQWEETCHQLALRRQQVSEKLNEWAVFNEKNKELCEWLTHMESKVSQNGDITIEEMIEKLRKDYQEEISVAEENKQQLEQMGERLARSSHESKAAEIHYKLSKVNERWQHLLDLIAARVKKLRETLVAVQQLDKNMSSLRSWLAHIETELSRPIVYETCDTNEIQKKLNQQQDMQRDIEKHSTGVASVLNLCEVLLHDCDACATETECDSIQQATRGLDRRWRNICAVAMERRLKIEETWRLWQKFLDDYSRFEDWLKASERTAALPNSSGVLYTVAKEELKKFEAFQRQVQECLTQLELINKQYRRLARENRTDSSCRLRQMVHDGNRRWDTLQRRVTAILRRLKHFISQREEFETARDSILVWLTEMDLQLTNIEHFSECDVQAKIKQLKAFQQEIELNTMKIGSVFSQGEALMEKSEPLDAAVIEEELDELQRYCREVFGRVERYYRKLTRLPLVDDDCDGSDREFDLDGSGDLSDLQWEESNSLPRSNNSRPPSVNAAPLRANGSGRDTPASVDSIPLEWDHDYDLEPMSHSISSDKRGRDGEEDEDILCGSTMRLMGDCRGSLDAVKRAEGELEEEEDDLSGLKNPENTDTQNTGVIARWELMQAQSHSSQNSQREDLVLLQQITSDLEAMEAWFNKTENELTELRGKDLSTDIRTIKERIRKLKELQKEVDAHKSKILSLNLSSVGLLQSDSEESRKLRERLKEMNSRWDRLGKALQQWRGALQEALMQCQEFHELSHGLLLWLENIDRRRNEIVPISSGLDRHTLRAHYRALEQIQQELVDSEQRVSVLQDLSVHLLVQAQGSECLEAQERVHVIGNRLRLLLKAVASDLQLLERELRSLGDTQDLSAWSLADDVETSGSASPVSVVNVPVQSRGGSACASSRSGTSGPRGGAAAGRCQSFLLRVLRAALPLQLLLLLIVGLACLVPMTEEDYSCAHANNFARSFHPMLRYTNGPPPI